MSNNGKNIPDPKSFPASDEFTQVEQKKLTEFREKVSDILLTEDQQDDTFLIRWLRARSLDINKAEDMLRKSMKWRQDNEIDTILEREDIPEEMKAMTPMAFSGISKDGYGVIIAPFGRHDVRAVLEKHGIEACERFNIINIEKFTKILRDEGKKDGKKVSQLIEIMDCEGYSYRQISSKLSREFMIRIQGQMDSHYPEVLRYAMIVNAPKVFAVLFAIMKPFVPKHTLEKIDVFGPDQEKWKAVVREKFPYEKIPPHWGGTLEGVDEYCSGHEIWLQGPKDMRSYMHGLAESDTDFHKVVINAREKFTKEVKITKENTILEWKFKTECRDIGFQLTFTSKVNNNSSENGKTESQNETKTEDIIKYSRVDAHNSVQEGSRVCEVIGKYTFIYDNSFSMLKSKTLLYQIMEIDPEHQEHPEIFEDCPEI